MMLVVVIRQLQQNIKSNKKTFQNNGAAKITGGYKYDFRRYYEIEDKKRSGPVGAPHARSLIKKYVEILAVQRVLLRVLI